MTRNVYWSRASVCLSLAAGDGSVSVFEVGIGFLLFFKSLFDIRYRYRYFKIYSDIGIGIWYFSTFVLFHSVVIHHLWH